MNSSLLLICTCSPEAIHRGKPLPKLHSYRLSELNCGGRFKGNGLSDPNGIYMKLMNFRRFDPVYQAQGKTGLSRGNKLEEVIWDEFAATPDRLTKTANAIVANLDEQPLVGAPYEIVGIEEAEEGRVLTRAHLVRERSGSWSKPRRHSPSELRVS